MTHVKSDLNEIWSRTDNDIDNGTQDKSSGSGRYLTTACMNHMQDSFEDNSNELMDLCASCSGLCCSNSKQKL